MTQAEFNTPLPIANNDAVYRQAHVSHLMHQPGNRKIRFPKESHFKPDADGLSVNWNKFTTVSGVYHLIGLSYKKDTTDFKDPRNFKIFALPATTIRSIEGIEDVLHTPVYNGNPAPIGSPNNYAHASLLYPDDEEIRLKLSDYCQNNHLESYCVVDLTIIENEVNELRKRLDNTPYHRLTSEKSKER